MNVAQRIEGARNHLPHGVLPYVDPLIFRKFAGFRSVVKNLNQIGAVEKYLGVRKLYVPFERSALLANINQTLKKMTGQENAYVDLVDTHSAVSWAATVEQLSGTVIDCDAQINKKLARSSYFQIRYQNNNGRIISLECSRINDMFVFEFFENRDKSHPGKLQSIGVSASNLKYSALMPIFIQLFDPFFDNKMVSHETLERFLSPVNSLIMSVL